MVSHIPNKGQVLQRLTGDGDGRIAGTFQCMSPVRVLKHAGGAAHRIWPSTPVLAAPAAASQIAAMPTVEEIETALLRRMTPAAKLDVMHALWRQAWALKVAGVRRQHPDWAPEQVAARVREIFRGASS